MRRPHVLKATKGKLRPTNVIFFDTETTQHQQSNNVTKHILKMGVALVTRSNDTNYLEIVKEHYISDIPDFWDMVDNLTRSKTVYYLVAHNITFDLTVLNGLEELLNRGWTLKSFYSKGMVSIFRWSKEDKKIIALDNSNFFSGKLAKWGDILGYPKLDIDFKATTSFELYTYCYRDVEIMLRLWRMWLLFLDDNKCGNFKPTVASTAFNTWRYRFLKSKVWIHTDKLSLQLERESYKGGRVECLFQGKTDTSNYHYVDINNMYGHVLVEHEYPAVLLGSRITDNLYMLYKKLNKYAVIADVTIDANRAYFPLKINRHTTYPLGSFRTTLTTPELKLAIDNGYLLRLHAMSWYKTSPLFSDYIQYFHRLRNQYRKEDNQGFAKVCKLLNNSLYGKFGQRGLNQTVIGTTDENDLSTETVYDNKTNEYYTLIRLGGSIFKETREGESYHSFPGIAAHVTAYARLLLADILYSVPYGHVYYMDTDSLIVDDIGLTYLQDRMHDTKLGYIKIERSSSWLRINAPKDYSMDGRNRIKGISPKATEISEGVFEQDQWIRLAGMIQSGTMDGYYTKRIIKHQRRIIHSGTVDPSGWVVPFVLQDGLLSDSVHLQALHPDVSQVG